MFLFREHRKKIDVKGKGKNKQKLNTDEKMLCVWEKDCAAILGGSYVHFQRKHFPRNTMEIRQNSVMIFDGNLYNSIVLARSKFAHHLWNYGVENVRLRWQDNFETVVIFFIPVPRQINNFAAKFVSLTRIGPL